MKPTPIKRILAVLAVLLLLVLQLSFLIPPMGYAVMMARASASANNTGPQSAVEAPTAIPGRSVTIASMELSA